MNLFAVTLLSASMGTDPLGEEIRQNFSGGAVSETLFRRVGPGPMRFMKTHPTGLRVTLPGDVAVPPVGVASRLAVHGDFEITATYQILKLGKPSGGHGAGVRLWIGMASPAAAAATLGRIVRPQDGDVYLTDHGFKAPDGKRAHQELDLSTSAKAGKLRLTRSGSTLVYLAADGLGSEFQELRREKFGSAPLHGVRIAADTGGAPVEVDVLLVDFEIRARELSASPPSERQAGGPVWGVGLAISAALALGAFLYWRRRRGKPFPTT